MSIVERKNVQMTEWYPEEKDFYAGAKIYRLLQWEDKSDGYRIPQFEVYEAEIVIEEDGDAESGPSCSLRIGDWETMGSGMGVITMDDVLSGYCNRDQDWVVGDLDSRQILAEEKWARKEDEYLSALEEMGQVSDEERDQRDVKRASRHEPGNDELTQKERKHWA